MATTNPGIGERGGQEYPLVKSISGILNGMADGGIEVEAAVIKELLQNADDAEASEVSVILDERVPPRDLPAEYLRLICPAILVRNNKHFQLPADVAAGKVDDFTAIRRVALEHKENQVTAAGRFGIGFNSVYFLTDTPVIFSRREVHVFDLLHWVPVFEGANGWIFRLDAFPRSSALSVGPVKNAKNVVDWFFPPAALGGNRTIQSLANDPNGDFREAVVRLPLRNTTEGEEELQSYRFPDHVARRRVLDKMARQAARAMVFLKTVRRVTFEILRESGDHRKVEPFCEVEATPSSPEFRRFLQQVEQSAELERKQMEKSGEFERTESIAPCNLDRTVTSTRHDHDQMVPDEWRFRVKHVADFGDDELRQFRQRLWKNHERAVPWGAIAIPTDPGSARFDGEYPAWRVFLPLREKGPSACLFHGAFFVTQSRRYPEFKLDEEETAARRTNWNKLLVEKVLVPLLDECSRDFAERIPDLIKNHPKLYLSLFPRAPGKEEDDRNLADYFRQCFAARSPKLRLFDIWDNPIDWQIGDDAVTPTIEMVPEWLLKYRNRFTSLNSDCRRFLTWTVGDALRARFADSARSTIRREVCEDILDAILRHDDPPEPEDLQKLLEQLAKRKGHDLESADLDGRWCCVCAGDGRVLRYSDQTLYVVCDGAKPHGIHEYLRQLGIEFDDTEWIKSDVGLPSLSAEFRRQVANLVLEDADGAIALLRRVRNDRHDILSQTRSIKTIVDFLIGLPAKQLVSEERPLRLAFLVRTAASQHDRRRFGVIFLKPELASDEDEAIWEALFRRTLAAADSGCARELHRLWERNPDALDWLRDEQCDVFLPTAANALTILDLAMRQSDGLVEEIHKAVNRPDRKGYIKRATTAVIREAVQRWDQLSEAQQDTVLALPIHRIKDGYVALIGVDIGDRSTLRERCRIQSVDNITDAPIAQSGKLLLLESADPSAKLLYRDLLQLNEHGRPAVLKDVLQQIGSAPDDNVRMLEYLGRYLHEALERLSESADRAQQRDASEIRQRLANAKSIPCLDDTWQVASECWDAWELARTLGSQGWAANEVGPLLSMLFPDRKIAALDRNSKDRIRRVHGDLDHRLNVQELAEAAISSESPKLKVDSRIKLLWDNWRSNLTAEPAVCLRQMRVPTISGTEALSDACILPAKTRDLSEAVRRAFFPKAIDLAALAAQLGDRFGLNDERVASLQKELPTLLATLGRAELDNEEIKRTIAELFPTRWPELDDNNQKMDVLQAINAYGLAEELASTASQLNTVAIRKHKGKTDWISPNMGLSPRWTETSPPIAPESCPNLASANGAVREVWDRWCGLNSFERIAEQVIQFAAGKRGSVEQAKTARAVYDWLDRVRDSEIVGSDDFVATLRKLPWVFAKRGADNKFCRPEEVLVHKGEALLARAFWVRQPKVQLPKFCRRREDLSELGKSVFQTSLPADSIASIIGCLEHSAQTAREATMAVYELVRDLVDESPALQDVWRGLADQRSVFRLFREPDRVVPRSALFLGNKKDGEDFGQFLFCVKAGSAKFDAADSTLYRKLGVPEEPTIEQLLLALTKVDAKIDPRRAAYHKLLVALQRRDDELSELSVERLRQVKVVTCDGRYRPLSECYWDEVLGNPRHLEKQSHPQLIDSTDKATKAFIEWLMTHVPGVVQRLTASAIGGLSSATRSASGSSVTGGLLEPWREWFEELARRDTRLHQEAIEQGFRVDREVDLSCVERMTIEYRCPNGDVIRSSKEWAGPLVFRDETGRIVIRSDQLTDELVTDSDKLEKLDGEIRRQVIGLLLDTAEAADADKKRADEFVRERVERPSVVLTRLKKNAITHLLYQYNDQAPDDQFSQRYDEFVRTREDSPRHEPLEAELVEKAKDNFVTMRREQIRAYGYDELSVLAELVQNAEDAYIQRNVLGMEDPPHWSIRFRFEASDDGVVLSAEHYGRPFCYWRHGDREDRNFRKDVEGVLRSSGSFKPQSDVDGEPSRVIGRFGLGFKSVYLLTDTPSIYSRGWNFRIDDGCLPTVDSRPSDLPQDATRISLPLRQGVLEPADDFGQHALCLLPFLSRIQEISIRQTDGTEAKATRFPETAGQHGIPGAVAKQVTLSVLESGREREPRVIHVIRVWHTGHAGQLAMLLASDGLPAPWHDAFSRRGLDGQSVPCDFYAVLPLKSDLGCGIAVSHRFEVQSGRTHLATSDKNSACAKEIAELLAALVDAVRLNMGTDRPLAERLLRFWNLWRWDGGDAETAIVRRAIADQLVALSRAEPIVPTLDESKAACLSAQTLFSFTGIPAQVVDELIAAKFALDAERRSRMTKANVLRPGFVGAYRRLSQFVGRSSRDDWTEVTWEVIGEACRNTPWLAEHPRILEAIGSTASEDARDGIAAWLAECRVRGRIGTGQEIQEFPRDLLVDNADVALLPRRLLKFLDRSAYSPPSVELLRDKAGLRELPTSTNLRVIIRDKDLTRDEAEGVLEFLRWKHRWNDYRDISHDIRSAWFPTPDGRITIAKAIERSLIDGEVVSDDEFKAWLGFQPTLGPTAASVSAIPPPRRKEPKEILDALYQWWDRDDNATQWTAEFDGRTYGVRRAPRLSREPDLNDRPVRKQWLRLLLLGSCHSIGRTQPEQHRDFLELCDSNNWLGTFADPDSNAQEWIDLLETYLDRPTPDIPYYQWVKLFVPIFQISRWLNQCVRSFCSMDSRNPGWDLEQVLSSRADPSGSGGGPDAPSFRRAFGIGACFVVRELCRTGVVKSKEAHRYCYVPSQRVRNLLDEIAGRPVFQTEATRADQSTSIYRFLRDHIGNKATFDGAFDLPLIAVCEKPELRKDLFGRLG